MFSDVNGGCGLVVLKGCVIEAYHHHEVIYLLAALGFVDSISVSE